MNRDKCLKNMEKKKLMNLEILLVQEQRVGKRGSKFMEGCSHNQKKEVKKRSVLEVKMNCLKKLKVKKIRENKKLLRKKVVLVIFDMF